MDNIQITYLVFGLLIVSAIVFDLGLLSKKNTIISLKTAIIQTIFWVILALSFFVFLWFEDGKNAAFEYISAYLMEWSLSIDNIFVFLIIFSSFKVKEKYYGRVLLIGILMAILFRIVFITVGVALVNQFHWLIYLFGLFLLFTGYKMFSASEKEVFDPHDSKIFKLLQKFLPLSSHDGEGRFIIREKGKPVYTSLFVVVVLLSMIDIVFAIDSIPAVFGISRDNIVIYTSNIFAVLGLRSMFFLLRGAISKFDYLQQGIAIVLIIIGTKMLFETQISQFLSKDIQIVISLLLILICIFGSILYSIYHQKKGIPADRSTP